MGPRAETKRLSSMQERGLASVLSCIVMGMVILLSCIGAEARNPNFRLCFRQAINVPGPTFGQPPEVDGIITEKEMPDGTIVREFGWTGAFRYVFGNGTDTADVIAQGIRDATNLYLSFEVSNDQQFDNEDVIVLTLDPTGVAANARLLHIYPVFANVGAGADGNPREVDYFTNSSSWTSAPLPAGVDIKVTSVGVVPPGPVRWFVEMQLPRAAFNIPASGDFGVYFNVMRANVPAGQVNEKFWPTDAPAMGLDLLNTPPLNTWGNATLVGTCNGVSIDVSDITTNNSPTSQISFPPGSNVFTALVHNNTVNGAGTPIPANQVRATFKIANFGIQSPTDWVFHGTLVPTGNNPTSAVNIGPNASQALSTSAWTLTPAEVTLYTARPHQCILVELDSTAPDTVFVNRSAWRNMDFVPTSQFERQAEISGRGYGPAPQGRNNHQFDLHVVTREETIRGREGISSTDDRSVSRLTWVAHGYRDTGNFITIKEKKLAIVDHVGSFGYIVQHQGPVASWQQQVVGQGPTTLEKTGENRYRLQVPPEGVVTVSTRVQAFEPGQEPPEPKRCFQTKASLEGFTLIAGLVALGLTAYAPRSRRK